MTPEHPAALDEERDFLARSIGDLDREWAAGDLDERDYRRLRAAYEARAQAAQAAQANGGAPVATAATGATTAMVAERGGARRVRTTIVVTAVVLAFAVGAGLLVARSSGARLAGQTVSGSLPGTSPAADELAKAQSLEQQGKALEALQQYDAVLRVDPRNAEALADEGWLLARLRVAPDKAQERLDAAIAADPGYALAYYYRAAFRYDARHDANGAIADLRSFLGANPPAELVSQAQDLLGQLLCETHQAPADFNCGSAPSTTAPSSTTTKP